MFPKLICRQFFSVNSLKNRAIPKNTPGNALNNFDTRENASKIYDSIVKFDELKAIYQKPSKADSAVCSFENFEEISVLSMNFLERMNKNGIFKPTDIQKKLLGHFFTSPKSDLLIKSQPGSGKSLGYLIILLTKYYESQKILKIVPEASSSEKINCKYLIIVPSELLAKQLQNWLQILSEDQNISSILCETFESINNDSPFMVATPESYRIKMARGLINLKPLEVIVLDEADALIKPLKRFATAKQKEMRAKHPVTSMILLSEIMKTIASNKLLTRPRMIVASATLNSLTREQLISSGIVLKDSIFLEDKRPLVTRSENLNPTDAKVSHFHTLLKDQNNPDELVELIHKIVSKQPGKLGAIFIPACQSKMGLSGLLQSSPKFSNISIDLMCNRRFDAQLLIASDVDCRGIDIPKLSYVIILDLPSSPESYIHMAGRVGRTGQSQGHVYTVLGTPEDFTRFTSLLKQISLTTIPLLEE